ncbi:hypothetical protein F4779DRAFT_603408 [Xylariaceae sp. FL0662B]|nr:hypothetical protein F4779DRAFT_603408 [Xylariaceae sp. FL0662B]
MEDLGFDPYTTPVGRPPPGVEPNFVNPQSQSWVGRLVVYLTFPLMVLVFALRLYARLGIMRQFELYDFVISIAVACTTAFCGCILPMFLDEVYGRHLWDIPVIALTEKYLKNLLLTGILYNCSAMFIKLSLLVLYSRLFRPMGGIQILIWLGIVVIVVFYMICNVLTLVFCIPRSGDGGWGSAKYNERCSTHYVKLTTGQGVFSAATDVYVLLIPVSMVMGLNLSLKKRVGVASIFLSGLLACGLYIAGAVYRFKDQLNLVSDYTWAGIYIQSFGVAELTMGVICCCLPVTVVLYVRVFNNSKSAWVSFMGYFTLRQKSRTHTSVDAGQISVEGGISPKDLPQIPHGTLSALTSFVRKGPRSKYREMQGATIQEDTYMELQSVDYDYHRHIHRN